jgi:hypothetical protein
MSLVDGYGSDNWWGTSADVLSKDDLPDPFEAQKAAYDPKAAPAGAGSSTMPASFGGPLPPGQTPPPSVNPQVIWTDPTTGQGYNPDELSKLWNGNSGFQANYGNVGDLLKQYGAVGAGGGSSGSPAGFQGTGVFSDPATSQYEKLLNSLISRMNTPYTPPDYQSTIDALKSYITRLNGPAYTPDQMALMQTQAFDPIMAARDQENQNIIARFAQQGMGPSSGPVQAAILANNQKFGQMGTTSRANVATGAIGQQNQNQMNAMALQAQIPTMETGLNTYNNQNAMQAAQYAGIIPQMAWSRLTGANGGLQQSNPLSALQLMSNLQTQGYNQGADYAAQLQQILPYLLKMFGIGN